MTKVRRWDRHEIKAELGRRGLTLTGVALDAGLYASACRAALHGGSFAGALALSKALEVPVDLLFPDRYLANRGRSAKGNATRIPDGEASQIMPSGTDRSEAA